MEILGQIKSSFIDYPGKICTVLFTGGCNFRCGYCHNPDIVNRTVRTLDQNEILKFLDKRKKYLDGVCISGGEPTLQKELYEFIQEIKSLGYLVKLDTNGTRPEVISRLLEGKMLDYIAMDVKGPLHKYQQIVEISVDTEIIKESIQLLINADIDYEFRTTIHKEILREEDLLQIAKLIQNAKRYSIQNIKISGPLLNKENTYTAFSKDELDRIENDLKTYVKELNVRY
jgi:pyruvate formate lyase activating enzyme